MLEIEEVDALARHLLDAERARARYAPLKVSSGQSPTGATLEDAYRVQRRLQALLRDEEDAGAIAGWKIALTSKAMQNLVHVDEPLAGCVFETRVHRSPARLSLAQFQHVGVEFEVAVWLEGPLGPLASGRHTRESVAASVGACAAAFELIEDRDADYGQIDAFSLIAENAWNAGVVLGPAVRNWQDVDLEHASTRLTLDGELAGEGVAGDALGHPFEALAWLANLFSSRGEALPAGSLIMTGSSITTRFPIPGQHFSFEVEGLGSVEARFEQ